MGTRFHTPLQYDPQVKPLRETGHYVEAFFKHLQREDSLPAELNIVLKAMEDHRPLPLVELPIIAQNFDEYARELLPSLNESAKHNVIPEEEIGREFKQVLFVLTHMVEEYASHDALRHLCELWIELDQNTEGAEVIQDRLFEWLAMDRLPLTILMKSEEKGRLAELHPINIHNGMKTQLNKFMEEHQALEKVQEFKGYAHELHPPRAP